MRYVRFPQLCGARRGLPFPSGGKITARFLSDTSADRHVLQNMLGDKIAEFLQYAGPENGKF